MALECGIGMLDFLEHVEGYKSFAHTREDPKRLL